MKNFWKIFRWLYLAVMIYVIIRNILNPIEIKTEVSQTTYYVAYALLSLSWLIPVIGIFLYSYGKRKFMIFWKLYFMYFMYNFIIMFIEFCQTLEVRLLLPFNAITLVGLFLYSFTKK